jgi:hypothetical protein
MIALVQIATVALLLHDPRMTPLRPAHSPVAGSEVALATVDSKEAARAQMIRAGWLLGSAVAFETAEETPRRLLQVGPVIAAHRGRRGQIIVSGFLGDSREANTRWLAARAYFPKAKIVTTPLPADADENEDDYRGTAYRAAALLVVGSSPSYKVAVDAAKRFSQASRLPYDTQGMVFDRQRGLIVPDSDPDEAFAGRYVSRRDDECDGPCVTVERSEAYPGFTPNLYIVVAGIVGPGAEGEARLRAVRTHVPGAYLKPTILYVGCRH